MLPQAFALHGFRRPHPSFTSKACIFNTLCNFSLFLGSFFLHGSKITRIIGPSLWKVSCRLSAGKNMVDTVGEHTLSLACIYGDRRTVHGNQQPKCDQGVSMACNWSPLCVCVQWAPHSKSCSVVEGVHA